MKKVIYLIIVIAIFYSGLSLAGSNTTGYVEIDGIRVGGGFLRVTGVTDFADSSNCNNAGTNKSRVVLVMEGTKSYKDILSFVLSAKMSNKPIQFWVSGCAMDSGNSFPKGNYVYIN